MNTKTPKLSIVIGTYNRLDQIKRCVESIERETRAPYVLYITDAGSNDGTIEYLESIRSASIIPILVGQKLGQAKAYNDVFMQVTTPYVCWLSDDNAVIDGGLDQALKALESDPRIGMVGLKTRDLQGPFIAAPYIGGISEIGILNVNQGMLRTDLLKQVGYFSEAFRDYGIDPDLTAKVLFSGYDIVYTKTVALHHYRNWSTDKSSPEYASLMEKNDRAKSLYAKKYLQYVAPSLLWKIKRKLLALIKRRMGKGGDQPSSAAVASKNIARDWLNILGSRYISLFDPLVSSLRPYHLRQSCPKSLLPRSLPDDNELA